MILTDVSVLISTMNSVIPKFFKKNEGLYLVVNQGLKSTEIGHDINWINSNDIGLSKSRNLAIKNSNTKYCCVSDNDVYYVDDYQKLIIKYFDEYADADVLLFQIKDDYGIPYKKYKDKIYKVDFLNVLNFSSIEIVFKRDSIIRNNIFLMKDLVLVLYGNVVRKIYFF